MSKRKLTQYAIGQRVRITLDAVIIRDPADRDGQAVMLERNTGGPLTSQDFLPLGVLVDGVIELLEVEERYDPAWGSRWQLEVANADDGFTVMNAVVIVHPFSGRKQFSIYRGETIDAASPDIKRAVKLS